MFSKRNKNIKNQYLQNEAHHPSFPRPFSALKSRLSLPLLSLLLLGSTVPNVHAAIPYAAYTDSLFARGFLNVEHYLTYPTTGGNTGANTAAINQAIKDAYNQNDDTDILNSSGVPFQTLTGSLTLYFPGDNTYIVNNTLKAYTEIGGPGNNFEKPINHIHMVGSTSGTTPPKIKLAQNTSSFDSTSSPKALLEFKNGVIDGSGNISAADEKAASGYHQMLRGIDLDCNSYQSEGNNGCIALYFHQAQNSSVENVNINVTGAHTGIRGTAGAAGGLFNVSITGGDTGIDTQGYPDEEEKPTGSRPGVVFAGLQLINQEVDSIKHNSIFPLTVVGFKITTKSGATRAALNIQQNTVDGSKKSAINLIDGLITLGGTPAPAAIDNSYGKNFYARNVFVVLQGGGTGSINVVDSNGTPKTATGARRLIREYNYTIPTSVDSSSTNLFNGTPDNTEYFDLDPSPPSSVPTDIASKHVWAKLPSVDDTDAFDASTASPNPIVPGVVTATHLQTVIDNHQKVFLPKGVYKLTGTVTLNSNTILFGAGRGLTRIEGDLSAWVNDPTAETPIIQTSTTDSDTATTYIGDLSIGVDVSDLDHDFFTALLWRSGASSMVHIGQIYRIAEEARATTQAHSLLKITGNGGGRWYMAGSIKTKTSQDFDPLHPYQYNPSNQYNGAYRILKAASTTQPMWFYALNAEHPRGVDTYVQFNDALNVRIYGFKGEYDENGTDFSYVDRSSLLKFTGGSDNVALFGNGAQRYGLTNYKGAIEFIDVANGLATLIIPQAFLNAPIPPATSTGRTLKETISGTVKKVDFPQIVTLYKRGSIDDSVMLHTAPSY